MNFPIYQEIEFRDPLEVFSLFADQLYNVFLDSAASTHDLSRYSFIGIDPFLILRSQGDQIFINNKSQIGNPFLILEELLQKYNLELHANLPPLQGGVMGYFGYDLCHHLENIPAPQNSEFQFSDLFLGFYDVVIAFDLQTYRAWIFSSGFPEKNLADRQCRAKKRMGWVLAQLKNNLKLTLIPLNKFCDRQDIQVNFSDDVYPKKVRKVIDYIHAGDVFQVNLSRKFSVKIKNNFSPFQLYQNLRMINPAPMAAYIHTGSEIIASASPERFITVNEKHIETRPIKGTRSRLENQTLDFQIQQELLKSEKDRAENTMIVDILRNDLARVAEIGTVKVPKLCVLESHATVHHLVSTVTANLSARKNLVDLLRASFPGGSITGAPKIRAMEIIYEIEPGRRGPYCGAIGYISFAGNMDTAIIIRTFAIKGNWVTFQAGGGIIAESDPWQETLETWHKARALIEALLMEERKPAHETN